MFKSNKFDTSSNVTLLDRHSRCYFQELEDKTKSVVQDRQESHKAVVQGRQESPSTPMAKKFRLGGHIVTSNGSQCLKDKGGF